MKKFIPLGILALSPIVVSAQGLDNVIDTAGNLIGAVTPVVLALALLYFFWGLAKYILSAGNEEKKTEGRNIMIWGFLALFIMVSVWGLVGILAETFNVETGGTIPIPSVDIRR
ncbi:hypothetical protein IIB50_00075 [Patescibacteria group bacterium]|nr:hypothetical protein [Patescibacteria group bacterium]